MGVIRLSQMTIDLVILVAMVAVSWPFAGAYYYLGLTNADYERAIGYLLTGKPYQTLTANRLNDCIMTCAGSRECVYMNVPNQDSVAETQCHLFNASTKIVHGTNLIPVENSTFFKLAAYKGCGDVAVVTRAVGKSVIYPLLFDHIRANQALCRMVTDESGWTLLQRRIDGSVNFDRDWQSYKTGFGYLESNFWLGLDAAHLLTKAGNVTLRFDLWDGPTYYFMEYYDAIIANEANNYKINWKSVAGNATEDSLAYHKNMDFSTKDKENDLNNKDNCAVKFRGGWWYKKCRKANLNGVYGLNNYKGINWMSITGDFHSLSKTEIKAKFN